MPRGIIVGDDNGEDDGTRSPLPDARVVSAASNSLSQSPLGRADGQSASPLPGADKAPIRNGFDLSFSSGSLGSWVPSVPGVLTENEDDR